MEYSFTFFYAIDKLGEPENAFDSWIYNPALEGLEWIRSACGEVVKWLHL